MAVYQYTKDPGTLDLSKLEGEIRAAGLPLESLGGGAIGSGDVYVFTSRDLTAPEKAQLDGIVAAHDGRPRRQRTVFAIFADIANPAKMSNAQRDAVIADLQLSAADLNSVPPPKWTAIRPPQDGPASAFRFVATRGNGFTAAEKREAAGWVVAMWCQQNPAYLTTAPFAFGIPGYEVDEPIA